MDELDWLTAQFQTNRSHLRAVAYRILGSLTEADDAVQESWLRVSPSGASEVQNPPHAAATSTRCSHCSTQASCSEPIAQP
jgi:DNA-directed RNA polymerase specialized sigma24 family protein